MADEPIEEMGPIDYIVLEWPGRQPTGEAAPLIIDLVDRGIIRILDIAFMAKGEDGSVAAIDLGELDAPTAASAAFDGASSGLLARRGPRGGRRRARARHVRRRARVGEPLGGAGRRRAAAAPAASSSPAAASPSRPSSPRSTRSTAAHD